MTSKPLSYNQIEHILLTNLKHYEKYDYVGFRNWLISLQNRKMPKYWDALTYYRVYNMYKNLLRDYDEVTVIEGYEGSGKSVLASQIVTAIDPYFIPQRVAYDPDDIPKAFENVEAGSCVWFDEGALFLFSRNSLKKENKGIVQLLTIVRQKNLHLCICVPNFFIIDDYVRNHRVKNLITIVKNRKTFVWIRREYISDINHYGRATKSVKRALKYLPQHAAFIGTWSGDFGITKYFCEGDYLKAKHDNMAKFMDQITADLNKENNNNTDITTESFKSTDFDELDNVDLALFTN